jgi:hypothetical protein
LPFHSYAGPGTNITQRINNKIKPFNRLDAAALIHDVEYDMLDQKKADDNMVYNIKKGGGVFNKMIGNAVDSTFRLNRYAKIYQPKQNEQRGIALKAGAENILKQDYPDVHFSDRSIRKSTPKKNLRYDSENKKGIIDFYNRNQEYAPNFSKFNDRKRAPSQAFQKKFMSGDDYNDDNEELDLKKQNRQEFSHNITDHQPVVQHEKNFNKNNNIGPL